MRVAAAWARARATRRPVPPSAPGTEASSRMAWRLALSRKRSASATRVSMASPRAPSAASSASASAGTCRTLRTGSGMRSRSAGRSCPWSCTASRPRRAAMAATSRAGRSAKTPTRSGPLPGASLARAAAMSASGLVIRQAARCAGHEVEADGVRAGGQRRGQPGHLGDAADLDEGRAAVRGRVHAGRGHRASRHEGGHARLHGRGIGAGAHEVLADERGVEADRPPAARVAASRTPDSATTRRSSGTRWRRRTASSTSTRSVRRSRLLMPMSRASVPIAERSSRSAWASTSGSRPSSRASATSRASSRGRWRAASSRTASAPAARSSGSWRASTTNSLASTGSDVAARAACRSSTEPPNQCGSTSTEIIDAPPAW